MKLGDWFETRTRDDGKQFCMLKDGHPEWLKDAVYAAHDDSLPDDWIYAECRAACDAIDEGSLKDEDSLHGHADGRVDVYTKERFQWAADFSLTTLYAHAEEEAKEIGMSTADVPIADRIAVMQYCAIYQIASLMLAAKEKVQLAEEEAAEEATAE